ncbi:MULTISPECIES: metal ABC transporter ATP-binding protein [unclassified Gemella]|uniref:metal ABC transporter ATP-binding protein n=1 Tax=unclassified Gemella TaxID=2624949 RepID=UPI001C03B0DB|nr:MULTISPECIES: metal ABC transporter ATP-binding protein [unclassified Gemella]MBU0279092.1 metal ABC transporter ATP-binding protein [Gemella sp. zg-1178]QWQ39184.1 metal ABC transporter ATP-binding protein [Gemella sp. zg-570]
MEYISVKNLSFNYDKDPVLENVNFHINSGEFVTITGENGAAKTTLVKILIGILKIKNGIINIAKKNINNEELTISYLPQQIASFNSGFPSTVYEFVKSGLYRKNSWFKKFTSKEKENIQKNLDLVGMWNKKDEKIGNLSGGQKQRIIIARMLMSDADILILDEPTTGMDEKTRNDFYNMLSDKVNQDKKTIIMITHDNDVVDRFATKNIHLCKTDTNSWCCKLHIKN